MQCAAVGLKMIAHLLAESKKDHLCILAAAKEGIPVFVPKIVKRGLWSVTKVNLLSYYTGGIFLPQTQLLRPLFPLGHNISPWS